MHSYYIAKVLHKLRLSSFKQCSIDSTSRIDAECVFAYVEMGRYSYSGSDTHITNAKIGNFVSIGGGCQIGGGNHPLNWVSTSPVFIKGKNIMNKNFSSLQFDGDNRVIIGNDVWIGDGCYIKAGVRIGNGSVIGAHAVVTRDVPPYTIVAGSPARVVRERFPEDIVNELQKIAWWNWTDEKIEQFADSFDDPRHLIEAVKGAEDENSIRG